MSRKFPIFQRLSSIKFTFSEIKQQNFYQRLGLNKTSSKVDIKSAFYKLAKMYHPDKNQKSSEKFKEILEAYKTLTDENLRRKYDEFLDKGDSQNFSNYSNQTASQDSWNAQKPEKKEYKFYRRKRYPDHFFEDNSSDLVQDGFLRTLKKSPELILLTVIMLALLVRWLFLYYGIIKMHQEKDKSNYYIDVNGNKKRKIGLSEKKLKQMSIEEIDVLERTGKYAMPLDYEEALENFRSNHFMKKSDNFRMFNYKNKLDGFNDKDIALGQVANLRAQQNIASQNNI